MHTIRVTGDIITASKQADGDIAVLISADGTQHLSTPSAFDTTQVVASVVGHVTGSKWVTTQGFAWYTRSIGEMIDALNLTRGDRVLIGDRPYKFRGIKGARAVFGQKHGKPAKIPLDVNEQLIATS